jgi:hypothetical protein
MRIVLFHTKYDKDNSPLLKGHIEDSEGERLYKVSLWPNKNEKVNKGVYYTGQVQAIESEDLSTALVEPNDN